MIEVRIRAFLKAKDETDVVTSTTMMRAEAPTALDVAETVKDLIAQLEPTLGDLRPMTAEEAEAYCAREEAES